MMSFDVIVSLIVIKEGDIFDCCQWQCVIVQLGKLMNCDSEIYNVIVFLDIYFVECEGNMIFYDWMMLFCVECFILECEKVWVKV